MVDNISKPFTFTANTYAKASEVNADFDSAYTGLNACINQVNTNTTNISNVDSNKANKNGDSTQVFNVADATNDTNAVNKRTLMSLIGNSLDYISGYAITKSSDNEIAVTSGSCYDSTKSILLNKNTSTTVQNDNQGANITYYIYVIGNSTGSLVDVLISTSSSSPALPTGYILYRQIGYYTTNADSKINAISYYGESATSDKSISGVLNSIMPDYSRRTTWSVTGGTVPYNAKVVFTGYTSLNGGGHVSVDGVQEQFAYSGQYLSSCPNYTSYLPVGAVVVASGFTAAYLIPLKGVVND